MGGGGLNLGSDVMLHNRLEDFTDRYHIILKGTLYYLLRHDEWNFSLVSKEEASIFTLESVRNFVFNSTVKPPANIWLNKEATKYTIKDFAARKIDGPVV